MAEKHLQLLPNQVFPFLIALQFARGSVRLSETKPLRALLEKALWGWWQSPFAWPLWQTGFPRLDRRASPQPARLLLLLDTCRWWGCDAAICLLLGCRLKILGNNKKPSDCHRETVFISCVYFLKKKSFLTSVVGTFD